MQSDMVSDYNNSLHSQYTAPEQKKESSVPNTVAQTTHPQRRAESAGLTGILGLMCFCDFAIVRCDI